MEDSIDNQDQISTKLIRHRLVDRCIDIFCKKYQLRRDKDKRVHIQISSIDKNYLEAVQMALSENWNEQIYLSKLKCLTEDLLGGRRTKEWMLRSKLEIE